VTTAATAARFHKARSANVASAILEDAGLK
jgi:hypothetical protein